MSLSFFLERKVSDVSCFMRNQHYVTPRTPGCKPSMLDYINHNPWKDHGWNADPLTSKPIQSHFVR